MALFSILNTFTDRVLQYVHSTMLKRNPEELLNLHLKLLDRHLHKVQQNVIFTLYVMYYSIVVWHITFFILKSYRQVTIYQKDISGIYPLCLCLIYP